MTGLVGQPQDSPVIGGGGDVDASSLNAPTGILGALVQRHGGAAATAAMALVISSAEGASFTVAEKRKKSRHTTKQPARGRQYQVKSRFTLLGGKTAMCRGGGPRAQGLDFDFCLSTSIPVLTTSTCVVAWPQGDQFLGGGM